jgi:hypothetical protein
MVLLDNLGIDTSNGSKLLRETLERHEGRLRLVYTPPYDSEANASERFWPHFRLAVTHNQERDDLPSLYQDVIGYFDRLEVEPNRVLRHVGSPYALMDACQDERDNSIDKAVTREEATVASTDDHSPPWWMWLELGPEDPSTGFAPDVQVRTPRAELADLGLAGTFFAHVQDQSALTLLLALLVFRDCCRRWCGFR